MFTKSTTKALSFLAVLVLIIANSLPLKAQVNLALGKTVTSSANFDAGLYPNSNLVDGNFSTFAHTGNQENPPNAEWFLVDLGADYFIDTVVIGTRPGLGDRIRRFMLVTYSSALPSLGTNPANYMGSAGNLTLYNRMIYTDPGAYANNPFGTSAGNPNVPGIPGQNLGAAFPGASPTTGGVLKMHIGVHRVRYILLMNLQDELFDPTELQVYEANPAVRSFVNGGFESPVFAGSGAGYVRETLIPGWTTTEPVRAGANGKLIEIWRNNANGVPAYEGANFAELNAETPAMLDQQPICVLPGETFSWSFAHRGRTGVDRMRLRIDDVDVAEFADTNTQGGVHTGTILPGVTNLTLNQDPTTATGWTRYFGTWTNTSGTSRKVPFGYRAVSISGQAPDLSFGNFLDDVRITSLSTLASFDRDSGSGAENIPVANLPKLYLTGTLMTPHTIQIDITGGTATRGVDYTTVPANGAITVTVPAGTYTGTEATAISLAPYIQINADQVSPELTETIIMNLQNPSSPALQIAGASACEPGKSASTYYITDHFVQPLPADLISFEANATDNCSIKARWESGIESNLELYQLEESIDGKTYYAAGVTVAAKGTNSTYEVTTDVQTTDAKHYYRLKMQDLGGEQTYSKTVSVATTCRTIGTMTMYPNPANTVIYFNGITDRAAVTVYDITGKAMIRVLNYSGTGAVDISTLPAGIYEVRVRSAAAAKTFRLVRQ